MHRTCRRLSSPFLRPRFAFRWFGFCARPAPPPTPHPPPPPPCHFASRTSAKSSRRRLVASPGPSIESGFCGDSNACLCTLLHSDGARSPAPARPSPLVAVCSPNFLTHSRQVEPRAIARTRRTPPRTSSAPSPSKRNGDRLCRCRWKPSIFRVRGLLTPRQQTVF